MFQTLSSVTNCWIWVSKCPLGASQKLPLAILVGSSRPVVLCKKGALGNLAKFTGKHLCQSLEACNLIKKRLWHRCFSVNFTKFLRTPNF